MKNSVRESSFWVGDKNPSEDDDNQSLMMFSYSGFIRHLIGDIKLAEIVYREVTKNHEMIT